MTSRATSTSHRPSAPAVLLSIVALVLASCDSSASGGICVDRDEDGYGEVVDYACVYLRRDCDDTRADVNPGAAEICGNRADEDCDGAAAMCADNCADVDGDRYGVGAGCLGPDCDDADPTSRPGGAEICGDGADQDCSGADRACGGADGGTGDGGARDVDGATTGIDAGPDVDAGIAGGPDAGPCSIGDRDADGYDAVACGGDDCDDTAGSVHRGATDRCEDGVDQDCSGSDASCPTLLDEMLRITDRRTVTDGAMSVMIEVVDIGTAPAPTAWLRVDGGEQLLASGESVTTSAGFVVRARDIWSSGTAAERWVRVRVTHP